MRLPWVKNTTSLLVDLWLSDRQEMENPRSRWGQQPQISSSPSSVPFLSATASVVPLQKQLNLSLYLFVCVGLFSCWKGSLFAWLLQTASGGFPKLEQFFVRLNVCNIATDPLPESLSPVQRVSVFEILYLTLYVGVIAQTGSCSSQKRQETKTLTVF